MKRYSITITAIVAASSQVDAEKIAMDAVEDYRGTKEYMDNDAICDVALYTVAEGDDEPVISMPDR